MLLPEAAGLCAGAVLLACLQEMERLQAMKQEYVYENTVSWAVVGVQRARGLTGTEDVPVPNTKQKKPS